MEQVLSLSSHVNDNFTDYIDFWRHNRWWLFDRPEIMLEIAHEQKIDTTGLTLFYYEAFDHEYDADEGIWRQIEPDDGCATQVEVPKVKSLRGYDVVTYEMRNAPECSPLSCNCMAQELPVNRFCLFEDFTTAHEAVATGKFENSEPGPYRIFAVYAVDEATDGFPARPANS